MALHNDLGKEGEELAVQWLAEHGYTILHRNWRHSYYEIDIVGVRDGKLHIIEVKTRKGLWGGHPESGVRRKKFRDLQKAADEFMFLNPGYTWLQYDVLAITLFKDKPPEYFLLEDVYIW